ncbi:type IV secretion system DNA-binding domain-containing protein [Gilvimarinus xylanilyticus]|uniref:Type IV secretion system DNA-binding domain-containing protein n=1 Tax=Gilvimarinus xylanilyticus TaxID=2944139 RepID=A0A9X2HXS0_9GAMM|nr:type IV secretion system DNA-binding domain-containing protein [Gilvimarinus xylanilyticus]MCP8898974.1 type IV secretion system DNA-binding domain-containing protein [Gilvimarinus xylanilyticus]
MNIDVSQVVVIQSISLVVFILGVWLSWRTDKFICVMGTILGGAVWWMARFHSLFFWEEVTEYRLGTYIVRTLWLEGAHNVSTWWGGSLYPAEGWSDWVAWTSAVAAVVPIWALLLIYLYLTRGNSFVRGSVIIPIDTIHKKLRKMAARIPVFIGGLPLPESLETRSLALLGEPGTGKTQIIKRMLGCIFKRNDRVVAIDVGGELYSQFGRQGDCVLSVSTEETERWSPFADIAGPEDCTSMANVLIPSGEGEAATWNSYTRTLLSNILQKVWETGERKNSDIIFYAQSATVDELKQLLQGTSSQRLFEPGSERMLSNVLSILSSYMEPLRYLDENAGEADFSLKAWLTDDHCQGWLWVVYDDETGSATASLRTAWIDILTRTALSLEPDGDRRIWFFLDELASLGKVEILSQALARGRKYGLGLVLGIQNISQLFSIYGRDEALSILGSVGHTAILRTPDPETADYLSRTIGETEVTRDQYTRSGNSVSSTEVQETKRVVLASEIAQLPDRQGYLKIAGVGWTQLKVSVTEFKGRMSLTPIKRKYHLGTVGIVSSDHTSVNDIDDL